MESNACLFAADVISSYCIIIWLSPMSLFHCDQLLEYWVASEGMMHASLKILAQSRSGFGQVNNATSIKQQIV